MRQTKICKGGEGQKKKVEKREGKTGEVGRVGPLEGGDGGSWRCEFNYFGRGRACEVGVFRNGHEKL